MKCRECDACRKGWFKPDEYVCIGVPEPFVIKDINVECTEYEEKRNKVAPDDEAIIDKLFHILRELDARTCSCNCIHSQWIGTSWIELCDKGIDLFKKLKG